MLEWWSNGAEAPEVVAIEKPPLAQISRIDLFFPRLTGKTVLSVAEGIKMGVTPSLILPRRGGEEERRNGFENDDT